MADWWIITWWAGSVLGILALVVVAWSLLRDRSRGRRRCPRCWYDMSGIAGLKCPECGREQGNEKRFFRTRRRWRGVAAGGLLFIVAGVTATGPAIYTGKWTAYTPVPVLRLGLSFFDEEAETQYRKLGPAMGSGSTSTTWGRLLAARAISNRMASILDDAKPAARRWHRLWLHMTELSGFGTEARVGLPELRRCLTIEDEFVRVQAIQLHAALGELAKPNVPHLGAILLDPSVDGGTKLACLGALEDLGMLARRAAPSVRRAMHTDPSDAIRLRACWTLASIQTMTAARLREVSSLAADPSFALRRDAVEPIAWLAGAAAPPARQRGPMLMQLGGTITVTPATSLALAPESPVIDHEAAISLLLGWLDDPDPAMRTCAGTYLAHIGERVADRAPEFAQRIDAEASPAARRAMVDLYLSTRRADLARVVRHVPSAFEVPERDAWRWAVRTLARCGPQAASVVPQLRALAFAGPGACQVDLCEALGVAGMEGLKTLEELLLAPGPVGEPAARALGWAGWSEPTANTMLMRATRSEHPWARCRAASGLASGARNSEELARLLAMALGDPSPEVQLHILPMMQSMPLDIRIDTWSAALGHDRAEVRTAAGRLLAETASSVHSAKVALEQATNDDRPHVRALAEEWLSVVNSRFD
jgi:hypothetical protein